MLAQEHSFMALFMTHWTKVLQIRLESFIITLVRHNVVTDKTQ